MTRREDVNEQVDVDAGIGDLGRQLSAHWDFANEVASLTGRLPKHYQPPFIEALQKLLSEAGPGGATVPNPSPPRP